MKLRGYTLWALFKKDFRLAIKNKSIVIILFMPIGFSILYKYLMVDMMNEDDFILLFMQVLAISIIPLTTQSLMIAEEKEKNTMRTLMLSDVSSMEFLLSKSLVSYLHVILVSAIVFFQCGADISFFPVNMFLVSISSITIIFFGSMVGILCADQTAASTLATPAMMFFMLPSLLVKFVQGVEIIARFIPTFSFEEIYVNYVNGIPLWDSTNFLPIVIMMVWIVGGAFLFQFVYRKKAMDN